MYFAYMEERQQKGAVPAKRFEWVDEDDLNKLHQEKVKFRFCGPTTSYMGNGLPVTLIEYLEPQED